MPTDPVPNLASLLDQSLKGFSLTRLVSAVTTRALFSGWMIKSRKHDRLVLFNDFEALKLVLESLPKYQMKLCSHICLLDTTSPQDAFDLEYLNPGSRTLARWGAYRLMSFHEVEIDLTESKEAFCWSSGGRDDSYPKDKLEWEEGKFTSSLSHMEHVFEGRLRGD